MLVSEDVEHALHRQRICNVDPLNATPGNGGRDHDAMRETGHIVFGRVLRNAGNFRKSVDPGGRFAEMTGEGHSTPPAYLMRLSDCDCGVPRAAWPSARRTARRASSILKSLWPKPRAPRSSVSAACAKLSRVGDAPLSCASAARSRHGLCATPPSARRASLILSPSISRPTATDTRANAYDRRSRILR